LRFIGGRIERHFAPMDRCRDAIYPRRPPPKPKGHQVSGSKAGGLGFNSGPGTGNKALIVGRLFHHIFSKKYFRHLGNRIKCIITIPEEGILPLHGFRPSDAKKVISMLEAIGFEGGFSASALPPDQKPYLVAHIQTPAGVRQQSVPGFHSTRTLGTKPNAPVSSAFT